MSALLRMRNVTAGYSEDIDILSDLSLSVPTGTIAGLIGLNGAGKSTVMKTIYGFLTPKSGEIVFDDEEITGVPPHRLIDRGLWYIPQESSLFPYLTVEDNLDLPLRHLAKAGRGRGREEAAAAARFEEVYREFPVLRERRRAQAGDLSGGQQKMLEFAKAYLIRPRLCLIDEPSIGLAPKVAEEVYGWIDLFAREGMTILLVDHNVRRVIDMAEYVYVLSLGRIAAEGSRRDFQTDLHDQVRSWLGLTF